MRLLGGGAHGPAPRLRTEYSIAPASPCQTATAASSSGSNATVASLTGPGRGDELRFVEHRAARAGLGAARGEQRLACHVGGSARASAAARSTAAARRRRGRAPGRRAARRRRARRSCRPSARRSGRPAPRARPSARRRTPAQASITLSELSRTRLGEAAGERSPSGSLKRSSSSRLAEAHAGPGAVDVDARLAAVLFGPGDDPAVVVAEQRGDPRRAAPTDASRWIGRAAPLLGTQARVDRPALGPHGERFAAEVHRQRQRLQRRRRRRSARSTLRAKR